jgi:betaine-aldehyde dehydrogenase
LRAKEIFGPVMVAIRGMTKATRSGWPTTAISGSRAYVWTRDVSKAINTAHAIESGWVQINQGIGQFPGQSYGGYKQSGMGREYSLEGMLDSYYATEERHDQSAVVIPWA